MLVVCNFYQVLVIQWPSCAEYLMAKFVTRQGTDGWHWQLQKNGDILARGGPYDSREKAMQSVRSCKEVAPDAEIVDQSL